MPTIGTTTTKVTHMQIAHKNLLTDGRQTMMHDGVKWTPHKVQWTESVVGGSNEDEFPLLYVTHMVHGVCIRKRVT